MEAGAQQHDVTVHLDAGLLLGLLHMRQRDLTQIRDVAQIEADGLPHEQIERHFIDRLAVGIDVPECVDVRTNVIERGNEIRLKGHRIAGYAEIKRLGRFVTEVRGDDRPLE